MQDLRAKVNGFLEASEKVELLDGMQDLLDVQLARVLGEGKLDVFINLERLELMFLLNTVMQCCQL